MKFPRMEGHPRTQSHPPESNRRPTDYERTQRGWTATTEGRETLGISVRLANSSLEDVFTNRHVQHPL
jgi:hypothetical protein